VGADAAEAENSQVQCDQNCQSSAMSETIIRGPMLGFLEYFHQKIGKKLAFLTKNYVNYAKI
jgi:hypothetical protein